MTDLTSPRFTAAVAALRALGAEQGEDGVQMAAREVLHPLIEARVTEGLERGYICLIELGGGVCGHGAGLEGREPCTPFMDHATHWTRDGKPWSMLAQPYGVNWPELRELVYFAEKHGLRIDIDASFSWHYPGSSVGVLFRRDDTAERVNLDAVAAAEWLLKGKA